MPYVKQADRHPLDEGLRAPDNAGELNYCVTTFLIQNIADPARLWHGVREIVTQFLKVKGTRYCYINDAIGVLVCAKLEFARRTGLTRYNSLFDDLCKDLYDSIAAPYEDEKIKENGDVYPDRLLNLGPTLGLGTH